MKSRDKENILDDVRAAQSGYSRKIPKSIVDRLIEAQWCNEDDLVVAYEDLQKPDIDRVVLVFELPFIVRLPDSWIRVRSEYGNPYIRFRPADDDSLGEDVTLSAPQRRIDRTRVLMSYQLWERRRLLYTPYLEGLKNADRLVKTKLKAGGVLDLANFAQDLLARLSLQTLEVLREFIPVYRITSKDPFAAAPKRINRPFMMVKTGRIVIKEFKDSAEDKTPEQKQLLDYSQNLPMLRARLKSGRPPSIYENYLLEAARQIEQGSTNLAVVQTVMVLDWFANEIIEHYLFSELGTVKKALKTSPALFGLVFECAWENRNGRIGPSTEDKFIKYFPIIGVSLPSELKGQLKNVLKVRNGIVHRTQAAQIDPTQAQSALDVGMVVIRHSMDSLISRKPKASSDALTEETSEPNGNH